ncbi:MAG: restriction endonuclease subunit S [Bacteroidales bacterium]|nr:restriction endonuclease subunit S [Bacteroidales bacterium]
MSETEEMYFNDFIKLNRGFDLPESKIAAGKYPIAASTSIKDYHNAFKVKAPCVTTGRSGSLGTVLYINENCWPLNTALYVKDYKGNFPKYVYYFLQTMKLESFNCGAGVPTLNQNHLHKIKIKVHRKEEQAIVASILSTYDELIENNNRRIAILEQTAEQIYKEWFVRIRFPGYENTEFEKGVPKDWEITYLRNFIKLNRGFDLPDEKIIAGNYPVIASTSIKAYHHQYKVEAPCITTGRSGSLGTVQYVNAKSWPLNTSLYVKDFKGNSPIYVYYFLKSIKLENFNSGAGVPTLNQNHLQTLKFGLPSKTVQNKFEEIISPIFKQIEIHKEQNQNLKQTRDLLLPRLISGKLKAKEAEKEIETV